MPNKILLSKFLLLIISSYLLLISGCSSGRYGTRSKYYRTSSKNVKVLLNDARHDYDFLVEQTVLLSNQNSGIAIIKRGNALHFETDIHGLTLKISNKIFHAEYFTIKPEGRGGKLLYRGKRYSGYFKFVKEGTIVRLINAVPLEDYVKGVVPAEMPLGRGREYFEALKAFAICVRTYAVDKFKKNGSSFDVYMDTRDQMYGGESAEKKISDLAVDQTRNLILSYEGKPAIVYYSSTCGGHTAKASNVFPVPDLPYLRGVKDGDPANCSDSPNFSWVEKFPDELIVKRLVEAGLISSEDYKLQNVDIESRFESGRVNKLNIELVSSGGQTKDVTLHGNNIRYVLKEAESSGILKSTLFNVTMKNGYVIINGKGYGHGVGLCQWGALHLSKEGKNFMNILYFYFPGTEITEYE